MQSLPPLSQDEKEELAALCALGLLDPAERRTIEASGDDQLRTALADCQEVAAGLALAGLRTIAQPPADLKDFIRRAIEDYEEARALVRRAGARPGESVVVTDAQGYIRAANEAFTALCGYEFEEMRGRKAGSFLQGTASDPAAVAKMREAVHGGKPCAVELVNYHKTGRPYWVAIEITPVYGEDSTLRAFFSIEREIPDRAVAA